MNLGDLTERYRLQSDDDQDKPLLSNSEVRMHLNDAVEEAARRSLCLVDDQTPETCRIQVTAGVHTYPVSGKVILIRNALIPSKNHRMIRPVKADTLNAEMPGWQSRTGEPQAYVVGLNSFSIRIYPTPVEDFELHLHVNRTPVTEMVSPSDEPDSAFAARYHKGLVNWVLYQAFSKRDVDAEDESKASRYLRLFEREFGTDADANAQIETFEANNQGYCFNSGRR